MEFFNLHIYYYIGFYILVKKSQFTMFMKKI